MWKWAAAAVFVSGGLWFGAEGALATPGLTDTWPVGLPDVAGWETASGAAELAAPHRFIEYELYVSPQRNAVYTLARYRVTIDDPDAARVSPLTATEKLQWDVDGHDVRRYECVGATRSGQTCEWRELPKGGSDYLRETGVLLSVYALHRRLLRDRDEQPAAPPAS